MFRYNEIRGVGYKSVLASPTSYFMFRCTAGNIVVIRFQKSVTPPSQAVRNIACNIFQFMLPHHTKPPTASWSKSCCRILRALTLSASKTVSAPPSRTLGTNEDFRLRENLLIALLIRRASRATFPDMGRLTDLLLPTIVVKTTIQFCFYVFIL